VPVCVAQIFRTELQNFSRTSASQLVVEWNDVMQVSYATCRVVRCMPRLTSSVVLQHVVTLFQNSSSMEFEPKRFIITFVQAPKTQTESADVARVVLDLSHFASVRALRCCPFVPAVPCSLACSMKGTRAACDDAW
jgi:hypothetical protein